MKQYRRFAFFILISACLAPPVFGCAVPVFRYALERWAADDYDMVIIHRGPLADDDPASSLLKGDDAEFLNLRISMMDLETSAENEVTSLLGGAIPETLPALSIWYPLQKGRAAPIWTGEFTPAAVKSLIQSPKRLQLAQRLTDGQTAVWVVVESGNAAKDKTAMQMLDQQLATATKKLKEMASELAEELEMPGLSYEFSTLTISRSDPQERMLLEMLLKSEPDLGDYADGPIVFPVFGRGRALYALASEGINADTIRETIAFITGPCGCEIKMLNPGVDLLMSVNWDAAAMQFYQEFYEMAEEPLPELTGVFPEEPADASLQTEDSEFKTQDKGAKNATESEVKDTNNAPAPVDEEQAQAVKVRERKLLGLGVMGTTGIVLGVILLAVVLGTMVISPQRKGHP